MNEKQCGFIAILGAPNAGKSTLLNSLVGEKVSIVSPKVQTTRRRILGLVVKENAQAIFVDTPGIFSPKKTLEKQIVSQAFGASEDADINLFLVDVAKRSFLNDYQLIKQIPDRHNLVLVFNKIDKIPAPELLKLADNFQKEVGEKVQKIFMISALSSSGVKDVFDYCKKCLPVSPWLYDPDQITDLPERLWAAEITREQVFLQLQEELPYQIYVETEKWETLNNGDIKIYQKIVVAKEGQKRIVLGNQGKRIKSIGQNARRELEKSLRKKIHLFLFVKVSPQWMEKKTDLFNNNAFSS